MTYDRVSPLSVSFAGPYVGFRAAAVNGSSLTNLSTVDQRGNYCRRDCTMGD